MTCAHDVQSQRQGSVIRIRHRADLHPWAGPVLYAAVHVLAHACGVRAGIARVQGVHGVVCWLIAHDFTVADGGH